MPDHNAPRGTAELLGRNGEPMPTDIEQPELVEREIPPQEESMPLIDEQSSESYRSRWQGCQAGFVDEPQSAVQEADQLVAEVMEKLATQFAEERERLEGQWSRGEDVTTEELRKALQRYRSFFNRLLQV